MLPIEPGSRELLSAILILDAFMGSGSTCKASQKLGRRFIGIEMEEGTFEETLEHLSQQRDIEQQV